MSKKEKPAILAAAEQWLAPLMRAKQRRTVAALAGLSILGFCLLLLARNPIPAAQSPVTTPVNAAVPPQAGDPEPDTSRLEANLAEILGRIYGAGGVKAKITLAAAGTTEWERNRRLNRRTVEDRTADGGIQITSEETEETTLALVRRTDGSESPVESTVLPPRIAGALIVATGADDPAVQSALARAAAAYLGIDLHKVMVLPGEVTN